MEFKRKLASAVALNIVLRCVTFLLSAVITRQLTPSENGVNFSFQLYFNTVLFLAREPVRSVNARHKLIDSAGNGVMVLKVMQCAVTSVLVGIAVMLTFEVLPWCGINMFPSLRTVLQVGKLAPTDVSAAAGDVEFQDVVAMGLPELLLVLSIVVMLSMEPCISLAQSFDCVHATVASEFCALLTRLLVTLTFVRVLGGLDEVSWTMRMCFTSGIFAYTIVTVGYFLRLWNLDTGSVGAVLQRARAHAAIVRWGDAQRSSSSPLLLPVSLRMRLPWCFLSWRATHALPRGREMVLFFHFFRGACLRLVLAEGGRFALVAFGSAVAMGHYELVSSLGSVIARLVFRLWENACFIKWSRDIAGARVGDAVALLLSMLRVASYFGGALTLVGPPLAEVFLLQLFSLRWCTPEAVAALQQYCYLLPLLAWYGLLDAFLRAAASSSTLRLMERVMVAQAVLYASLCFVVLQLHWIEDKVVGLIVANGIVVFLCCLTSFCFFFWVPMSSPIERQLQRNLSPEKFLTIFEARIVKTWALLFVCTRWAMKTSPTFGVVAALCAAPVFAASVMRWDPDIRTVLLGLVRG